MDRSPAVTSPKIVDRPSSDEIERLSLGFQEAVKRYRASAERGNEEGPYLVCEGVAYSTFEVWSSSYVEPVWKVAFILDEQSKVTGTGTVLFYGDPSLVHEAVHRWLDATWQEQAKQHGLSFRKIVQLLGSTTQKFQGEAKEPDLSYTSRSARAPRHPRTTLEVAYRNENLPELVQEVGDWHRWGTLLSMGVKILVKKVGRAGEFDISLFWVHQLVSDQQPTVIDFSPQIQLEDKFVQFCFSCFTEDVDVEDCFDVKVDLVELREFIMEQLLNEAEDNHMVYEQGM